MKLIKEARAWHKLWSMRLAILAAVFGTLELVMPIWQSVVPESMFAALSTVSAVGAAVARVIKQGVDNDSVA
jgi:hypothetical protein